MSIELNNLIWKYIRPLSVLVVLSLLLGLENAAGSQLQESEWQIQTVDVGDGNSNDVGEYSSIALDNQGMPYISYYDIGNGDLKFANGSQGKITPESLWVAETVDRDGDVGKYSSLAIDDSGYALISYYDDSSHDLKFARQIEGGGWFSETVDFLGDVGRYSSLALDEAGNPHISYYVGYPNFDLKYAFYDGTEWNFKIVDESGNVGQYTSLALDSNGNPHISYFDASILAMKYAYRTSSGWLIQTLEMGQDEFTGGDTSLALDRQGSPKIAYIQQTGQITQTFELNYAFLDGEWQSESVDILGGIDGQVSLALDRNDRPHIGYYDGANDDLKYAYLTSSGWQVDLVDAEGDVGAYPSIALDRFGLPHLSYRDSTQDDKFLKYATLPLILRQVYVPFMLQDWVRYFERPFEQEDNDAAWQANGALIFGQAYTGFHNDENDFFSVYLRAGSTLTIDLDTQHLEQDEFGYYVVQLMLYHESTSPEDRVARVFEPDYQIEYAGSEGWYYVRVFTAPGYLDGSKEYQITVHTP